MYLNLILWYVFMHSIVPLLFIYNSLLLFAHIYSMMRVGGVVGKTVPNQKKCDFRLYNEEMLFHWWIQGI
jgi:hypothetical protein